MGWQVQAARGGKLGQTLADIRVLLVDDDDDMRLWLDAVLQSAGCQVLALGSAADGLAALKTWYPDVLVSDIEMPGEDGYSLIRRIRDLEDPDLASTPAFALSAHARLVDVRMARAAGFDWHMAKPVEPRELINVVAALARRNGSRIGGFSA